MCCGLYDNLLFTNLFIFDSTMKDFTIYAIIEKLGEKALSYKQYNAFSLELLIALHKESAG